MPVRPAMSSIIAAVADLIGDPSNLQLTQQQLQDALDERTCRQDVRYENLTPAPWISNDVVTNSAAFIWLDYYSKFGFWETDEVVQEAHWVQLTPIFFEPIVGHWVFSASYTAGVLPPKSLAPGQVPVLFATGKVYDIYRAAVKCCMLIKAKLANNTYNFTADGQTLNRFQIMQNYNDLIKDYSRKIKPRRIHLVRSDNNTPDRQGMVTLLGNNNWIQEM